MIYDSLDTIPYKLFIKINETEEISLLSDEQEKDINALSEIWNRLYDEHLSKNQTSESKKILKLSRSIDEMITMNRIIVISCHSLRFDFNDELYKLITNYGYKLSTENTEAYYSDLEIIEQEANNYLIKAERYKSMMPDEKEDNDEKYTIDDVMSSYCSILGYNIGKFNDVTYNEFYAYKKSVNEKIASIKSQISKSNGK